MVLGQFSDICLWSANIRKLAKDHKGYGSAAMFPKKLSEHFTILKITYTSYSHGYVAVLVAIIIAIMKILKKSQ
jgi:hypothetical protein